MNKKCSKFQGKMNWKEVRMASDKQYLIQRHISRKCKIFKHITTLMNLIRDGLLILQESFVYIF